jgi:hypothetical protein
MNKKPTRQYIHFSLEVEHIYRKYLTFLSDLNRSDGQLSFSYNLDFALTKTIFVSMSE